MSSHISPGSYFRTNRTYYRAFDLTISTIIGEGELFMVVCCYPDNHHIFVKALDDITVKILHRSNLMNIAYWWVRDNCTKIV